MSTRLLKTAVQWPLRKLGYEVRRIDSERTWGGLLERMKRLGLEPGTVIDVGVAEGTPVLHEAFPNAHLLLVEPLVEYEDDLRRLTAGRPGSYVVAAASSQNGTARMHARTGDDRRVLEGSSLLVDYDGVPSKAREVPTVRVDTACADLPGPFVLKADVEGFELEVVRGALGILSRTELVILEVSLFPFREGAPELGDVVAEMQDLSFVVYEVLGGRGRPLDGALGQIDVAFVHKDGRFRSAPRHYDRLPPAG